ncbi:MAG: LysM peptidoglycan-binding domain-containing protein [Bacteroidales bacterium]|nr:LysM peptidoglycan-binding domain-containing protein [Bacteroidales bacterium]
MKKIVFFISILLISTSIFAQIKVEKSKDVVVVLGRKYYVHNVKQGETIYSIGKVYEVPEEDILLINKEAVENLKAGTALRIPLIDENYEPAPISKITFIEHEVERKESLYSIAQQYNTTQDDIIEYNPQIENGIDKGMILKIPVFEQEKIIGQDDFFEYHQIKNGDNLQIIALQYGVTVREIVEFNDNAKELVVGEILAIPTKSLSEEQKAILKHNNSLNPDFFDIDPNYFEDPNYPPCSNFSYNDTMTFRVAFLLPFFTNENYSMSYNALDDTKNAHFFKNTKIFFDYLQGALLAIDKLRKEGTNLKIYMYDTKADSATTEAIFKKYEMTKMDLIFGPVYSSNYGIVQRFTEKYHINVIAPLSNRISIIENNPFVYKIVPCNENIMKYIALHVNEISDTCFIGFIQNGTPEQTLLADTFKNELLLLSNKPDSIDYKAITFSKFITPYSQNLSKDKHNIIIIPSTNEVEVSAILNNLNSLVAVNEYRITVYTMPTISNFTKLQSNWISNLNIHYASTTIKDNSNWDIKEFRQEYHRKFGNFPTTYSYTGYDVTYYFITALKQYGKYFQFCLGNNDEFMGRGIFMKFNFERFNINSGFENSGLYMMYYNENLELKLQEDPQKSILEEIN